MSKLDHSRHFARPTLISGLPHLNSGNEVRPSNVMPVILTTPDEVETWMTAPPDEVLKLQRPLLDGSMKIVARGVKEDPAGQTT
jgi:hypothetical protein